MFVCVCVCVCALYNTASGAESCLWPSAMVRLAPHWHAVKWAGIIGIAICTIGYLHVCVCVCVCVRLRGCMHARMCVCMFVL